MRTRVILVAACVMLAVGCGPARQAERKLVLRDSGIPVRCSTGKDVEFGKVDASGLEWLGFYQDPFSRCSFDLVVPPGSRLSFRLSLAETSLARGGSASVAIHSAVGDTKHRLLSREVKPWPGIVDVEAMPEKPSTENPEA